MPNTKKFRTEEQQWSVKLDFCTFLFPTWQVLVVLITDTFSSKLLVKTVSTVAYSWNGSIQINIVCSLLFLPIGTQHLISWHFFLFALAIIASRQGVCLYSQPLSFSNCSTRGVPHTYVHLNVLRTTTKEPWNLCHFGAEAADLSSWND